MNYKTVRI